ncbi:MAG: hypothetical protein WC758_01670 [Candidatus Woesearchaeota archaeon]|jgi:hypothetical protein
MLEVISDSSPSGRKLLEERKRMQMENIPIDHSQLSLDKYLTRLSVFEEQGILKILKGILGVSTPYFRKDIYDVALLGVGTTTYSDEYWVDIEKLLEKDESKKKYVNNKGEDIDLLFCPEQCHDKLIDFDVEREYAKRFEKSNLPTHRAIFYHRKRIKNKIEELGYSSLNEDEVFVWKNSYDFRTMITGACIENKWKHTPWTNGAPFGANYFEVPEQFIEQEKQKFVRVKGKECGVENMMLIIPECRTFHIYVNQNMCRAHRMEYERLINLPFTLIDSPGTRFRDALSRKNGTYVETPGYDCNVKSIGQSDDISF